MKIRFWSVFAAELLPGVFPASILRKKKQTCADLLAENGVPRIDFMTAGKSIIGKISHF